MVRKTGSTADDVHELKSYVSVYQQTQSNYSGRCNLFEAYENSCCRDCQCGSPPVTSINFGQLKSTLVFYPSIVNDTGTDIGLWFDVEPGGSR